MGGHGDREHADDGRARHEQSQSITCSVGKGRPPGDADEPRVRPAKRAQSVLLEAEGRELRAPGQGLDELGRERSAGFRLARDDSPGEGRSRRGHDYAGDEQPRSEDECGKR